VEADSAFDEREAVWYYSHSLHAALTSGAARLLSYRGNLPITTSEYRINEQISSREVRLIGANNENVGIVSTQEAMRMAQAADKDLVEVSPTADPPVCRILDFGKFLYEKTKKDKEARRAQKIIEVKEIQLRPKTTDHHTGFKVRDARRWLEEGKKVKVRIKFRGREITYPQIARQELMEIAQELADVGFVEQTPDLEGRTMLMVLAPGGKKGGSKTPMQPPPKKPEGGTPEPQPPKPSPTTPA
jgi:translation initiation factor IF-3